MVSGQGARLSARFTIVLVVAALGLTALGAAAFGAASGQRPQGRWTIASWEVSRDPANPAYVPGTAGVIETVLAPQCGKGPCAIRVRGGGARGTYAPAGAPIVKNADHGSYRLVWNRNQAVYTVHRDLGQVLCTTSDGAEGLKRIPKGYTSTRDATYRFRAGRTAAAASLTGERVDHNTGTAASIPQGCTTFSVTSRIAAAPTGAVHVTANGAAGQYRITEVVDRTHGAGQRPRGFAGILVENSTVTAEGRALTITGVVGTATLRPARSGWSGTVKATQPSCVSTSTQPGYDTSETWTGVHPVARTETGAPVLAGNWRYVATPTTSGTQDGCKLVVNRGYVVLVPMSAITP